MDISAIDDDIAFASISGLLSDINDLHSRDDREIFVPGPADQYFNANLLWQV